jgi:hypothetical protein
LYRCCRPLRRGSMPASGARCQSRSGGILAPVGARSPRPCMRWTCRREADWARYHPVLSRVLLVQLVEHRVPSGPLLLAIDETPDGTGGPRSMRWGCIGTWSVPPMALSSKPRDCTGSACCHKTITD